jgi:hypothetical protein
MQGFAFTHIQVFAPHEDCFKFIPVGGLRPDGAKDDPDKLKERIDTKEELMRVLKSVAENAEKEEDKFAGSDRCYSGFEEYGLPWVVLNTMKDDDFEVNDRDETRFGFVFQLSVEASREGLPERRRQDGHMFKPTPWDWSWTCLKEWAKKPTKR